MMFCSSNELQGYSLNTIDGAIGKAKDFLFNDVYWVIRYLVPDTGKWLPDRKILISPIALSQTDYQSKALEIKLSQEQIRNSPPLESDKPVSRQFETRLHNFYGWPAYWSGDFLWGLYPTPLDLYQNTPSNIKRDPVIKEYGDPRLRSMKEVGHYHIEALDGRFGRVEDFILDDETWNIRYLIIDTRNWLPAKKVTISPDWISKIDSGMSLIYVDLSKKEVKDCPEYDPSMPIDRAYEKGLYDHYGRPYYW